jgi:hypothetical protein
LPSEPLSDQPRVLPSQPERVVVGLVFAACLLWFGATSFFGVITEDEAFLYVSARRMLVGDWPHRELESIYVLGRAWLLSGLFAIFGPTYLVERLFLGVLRAAAVTASYAGARSLLPRWASLVVALTVIAATGPPHKVFYALVPLCVLLPALRGLDGDDRWLLAAGVVAGVGCWVRQDTAIVAWLAALAAALAAGRRGRSVAALVGGALVGGGVPLAYVATQVDLERMFTEIVLYAFEDGQPGFERLAAVAEEGQIFPWPTVQLVWSIVAPSAALLGLVRAGHLTGAERGTWVLWSVVVALSSNQVFRENSLVRFLQAGAVAWPSSSGSPGSTCADAPGGSCSCSRSVSAPASDERFATASRAWSTPAPCCCRSCAQTPTRSTTSRSTARRPAPATSGGSIRCSVMPARGTASPWWSTPARPPCTSPRVDATPDPPSTTASGRETAAVPSRTTSRRAASPGWCCPSSTRTSPPATPGDA